MPDPAPDRAGQSRWSCVVRLHIPFLLAVTGCLYAGWFELTRARAGREVAWVYAVEWPLFAILGTYIWWRLLHDRPRRPVVPDDPRAIDRLDPGLVAWQEYLADLQAADPPGGPPPKPVNASREAPHSRERPPEREG
jgi:hypothetical protein